MTNVLDGIKNVYVINTTYTTSYNIHASSFYLFSTMNLHLHRIILVLIGENNIEALASIEYRTSGTILDGREV